MTNAFLTKDDKFTFENGKFAFVPTGSSPGDCICCDRYTNCTEWSDWFNDLFTGDNNYVLVTISGVPAGNCEVVNGSHIRQVVTGVTDTLTTTPPVIRRTCTKISGGDDPPGVNLLISPRFRWVHTLDGLEYEHRVTMSADIAPTVRCFSGGADFSGFPVTIQNNEPDGSGGTLPGIVEIEIYTP